MTIQRALVKEDPKILEDRGELTGLHGNMFESFDCIWSSKNTLGLKRLPWDIPLESLRQLWLPRCSCQR
jgi:hypothetical protein